MTKRPDDPAQDRQAAIDEMRAASALIARALHTSTGAEDAPDSHPLVPNPLAAGATAALYHLRERRLGPAFTAATIHLGYAIRAFHARNDMVETLHQAGEAVAAGERAVDEEAVFHAIRELWRLVVSAARGTGVTQVRLHNDPQQPTPEPEGTQGSGDQWALLTALDALAQAYRALAQLRYLRALVAVDRGREALQPSADAPGTATTDPAHLAVDHEAPAPEGPFPELGLL
jgi:hypothetical protein